MTSVGNGLSPILQGVKVGKGIPSPSTKKKHIRLPAQVSCHSKFKTVRGRFEWVFRVYLTATRSGSGLAKLPCRVHVSSYFKGQSHKMFKLWLFHQTSHSQPLNH